MSKRTKHTKEFKLQAVKLVKEQNVTIAQAARDLNLNYNVLHGWVKAFDADPQNAFPGHGKMKPEHEEIARLRKENAKLKMERDILKKAAAYFAKESK